MKARLRAAALVSLALVLPGLPTAQKQPRTIFVNAVDAAGAPVLDLTTADFEVSEGGASRTVTRTVLANGPMRIIIMVDTGGSADRWQSGVKSGLTAFVDTIPPQHEIGVVTIGRQFRVRLAPTAERVKLKETVNGLGSDGGGNVLLDGVRETENRFMKKDAHWPVYLMVTTDATLGNSMLPEEVNKMIADMQARGTTVHAVALQNSGPSVTTEIAMMLAKNSGGSYTYLNTVSALAGALKQLGTTIAEDHQKMSTRYALEYMSEAAGPGTAISVAVRRAGVSRTISFRRPF
jgi:hypothetical protein